MASKTHGVWWNIAGAGWVSSYPEHHNQLEMFPCLKGNSKHVPQWGGKPLRFTEAEATRLARIWTEQGWGPYEARPIHENVKEST